MTDHRIEDLLAVYAEITQLRMENAALRRALELKPEVGRAQTPVKPGWQGPAGGGPTSTGGATNERERNQ